MRYRHAIAIATVALAAGCGEETNETTEPEPPATAVASVTVFGPLTELVPGGEVQLTATIRDASGRELTGRPLTWSSTDDAVAVVSDAGLVTGVTGGRVNIRATSEGRTGGLTMRVLDGGQVGPEGGVVTAFGGAMRLEVPAGALTEPVIFTVSRSTLVAPDPSAVLGTGFEIGPTDLSLPAGASLTLTYDPSQAPSGVAESELRVHRFDGGAVELGGTVDPGTRTATAEVTDLGVFAVRRAAATEPCTGAEYRQFDFWVGSWVVEVAGAPPGAPLPTSEITLEDGGCAVFEDFAGGAGRSLNVYSPEDGNWHQTFAFSNGRRQILIGGLVGEEMILTGRANGPPGSFDRWTWTPLAEGRVRQLQEQSNDGGQTVQTFFDGTYVPR